METAIGQTGRPKGKVEIARRLRMHQASICRALAEANPGRERVVTAGGRVVFVATSGRVCGSINQI